MVNSVWVDTDCSVSEYQWWIWYKSNKTRITMAHHSDQTLKTFSFEGFL